MRNASTVAATVIAVSFGVGACVNPDPGLDGLGDSTQTCTVVDGDDGTTHTMSCSDGSSATWTDGAPGADGLPGADGSDGAAGLDGAPGEPGADGLDGEPGLDTLVAITDLPAMGTCPAGGYQVESGIDLNADGVLDADEVSQTAYVCNGTDGAPGSDGLDGAPGEPGADGLDGEPGSDGSDGVDGAPGADGLPGADGSDGAAGLESLVMLSDLPLLSTCSGGGIQVEVGLDDNRNGVLDPDEVDDVAYVCNGVATVDTDGDGTPDNLDDCSDDPSKVGPGVCGCGVSDTDSDGDGSVDCTDMCPADPAKLAPGICGCNTADTDTDGDGTANCNDGCPADGAKVGPGVCGCGTADTDSDGDGTPDCVDGCPDDPGTAFKDACGACPTDQMLCVVVDQAHPLGVYDAEAHLYYVGVEGSDEVTVTSFGPVGTADDLVVPMDREINCRDGAGFQMGVRNIDGGAMSWWLDPAPGGDMSHDPRTDLVVLVDGVVTTGTLQTYPWSGAPLLVFNPTDIPSCP